MCCESCFDCIAPCWQRDYPLVAGTGITSVNAPVQPIQKGSRDTLDGSPVASAAGISSHENERIQDEDILPLNFDFPIHPVSDELKPGDAVSSGLPPVSEKRWYAVGD